MKKLFLLLLVIIAFSSCAITEPVPMNYYPYPTYRVYYGVPYSYGYYYPHYYYGGYHHHR